MHPTIKPPKPFYRNQESSRMIAYFIWDPKKPTQRGFIHNLSTHQMCYLVRNPQSGIFLYREPLLPGGKHAINFPSDFPSGGYQLYLKDM
jgi:hypothetical protein